MGANSFKVETIGKSGIAAIASMLEWAEAMGAELGIGTQDVAELAAAARSSIEQLAYLADHAPTARERIPDGPSKHESAAPVVQPAAPVVQPAAAPVAETESTDADSYERELAARRSARKMAAQLTVPATAPVAIVQPAAPIVRKEWAPGRRCKAMVQAYVEMTGCEPPATWTGKRIVEALNGGKVARGHKRVS